MRQRPPNDSDIVEGDRLDVQYPESDDAPPEDGAEDPYAEQLRRARARQRRRRLVERLLYRKDALGRTVPDRRKWVLVTTGGLLLLLLPLFASVQWATGPATRTPGPEEESATDASALPRLTASPPAAPEEVGPAPPAARELPLGTPPAFVGPVLPPPPAPPPPAGAEPSTPQPPAVVPPFEAAAMAPDALAADASPQAARGLTLHAPGPPPLLVHRTPTPPPPQPDLPVVLHEAPLPGAPEPKSAQPTGSPEGSPASGLFSPLGPASAAPLPSGSPVPSWAASGTAQEGGPEAGGGRQGSTALSLVTPAPQDRPLLEPGASPSPRAAGGFFVYASGDSAADRSGTVPAVTLAGPQDQGQAPVPLLLAAPSQAAPSSSQAAGTAPAAPPMTLGGQSTPSGGNTPAPVTLAAAPSGGVTSAPQTAGITLASRSGPAPAGASTLQGTEPRGFGADTSPAAMTLAGPQSQGQAPVPLLLAAPSQAAPSSSQAAGTAPAAPPMTLGGQSTPSGGNTPAPVTLAAAQAGREKPTLTLHSAGGTVPPLLSQAPGTQGPGLTLSGTQRDAGGLSFAAPSTAPQAPQAQARSPYRIGAQLKGKLETRVLLPLLGGGQGERTMPAVAKTSDGTVWLGEATPGAGRLVQIQFRQAVLADGQALSVSAVAVSPDGTVGLAAKIREEPPALAQDLLRSAISGVSDYVQALKEAQSVVMTPDGFIATEKQVPDLQWFLAGKVAEAFGLPVQPGQSVVRLAEVPKETELFVLLIGER